MNDDQLAAELQRRANAASSRPDWARHDLLPAVWREIDARPQPVMTSRLSPRLGVAALVAALLILVVAVPRPVPGPATSSSSPTHSTSPDTAPGVLSTAEFAARYATGELNGETVLVDGTIGARPTSVGIGCHVPIGETCLMGQLEQSQPPLDVLSRWVATDERDPSVGESDVIWPWAYLPSGPVTGTLLLKVDSASTVEFLGLVRGSELGLAWSVADANEMDIDSVAPDEVILVDGWLVETEPPGTFITIDCMPSEYPHLNGLPTRYCQPGDYLSSDPAVDGLTPRDAARLSVQRDAGGLFGATKQDGTSLFAIAPRLYGECADQPPCWQWDVVARIDPVAVATPTPTPTIQPPRHELDCELLVPQVIDETGLVTECGAYRDPGDSIPFAISNPDGDKALLEISYSGVPACDGPDVLTLRRSAIGYDLVAHYTRPIRLCDGVVYETHILLPLSQPIHADQVNVIHEPLAPSLHDCGSISDPYFGSPPVFVVDGAGAVRSCVAEPRPGSWPAGDANVVVQGVGDAAEALEVAWQTQPCSPERILIELKRTGAGYAMRVILDRSGPDGYECAGSFLPPRRVVLALVAPINPGDVSVELEFVPEPYLPGTQRDLPKAFECPAVHPAPAGSLAPGRVPRIVDYTGAVTGCSQLEPGAPTAESVHVTNLNGFDSVRFEWIDQSCDGPIEGDFRAVNGGYELAIKKRAEPCPPGDPVAIAVDYRLPMPIELVVAAIVGPPPVVACTDAEHVVVVDEVGVVRSCAASDSTASPGDDLVITNPDGDESALQLSWAGSICSYEVHLVERGNAYSIDIYIVSQGCFDAFVVHTVTIHLTTPIRADQITGWSIGGPPRTPSP